MNHKLLILIAILVAAPAVHGQNPKPEIQQREHYFIHFTEPSVAIQLGGFAHPNAQRRSPLGRVKFDARAPVAVAAQETMLAKQNARVQAIEQVVGRQVPVLGRMRLAGNGVLVELTAGEVPAVAAIDGVRAVEKVIDRVPTTDRGPEFIGAGTIWDGSATPSGIGNMGEGIVIGVLDSGVNSDHPSFAATGGDGFTVTNPLGAGVFLGNCNPGGPPTGTQITCNDKLIGAYGFADGPEDDLPFGVGHGSHTSSTAGGNVVNGPFVVQQSGAPFNVPKISGVAPHANIIMYEVCDDGCPGAALTAGLDQVLLDGLADVTNYSIGPINGGQGLSPWTQFDDVAFLSFVAAGIFPAASAGNTGTSNPNPQADVAHKGPWIMTVANSSHDRLNSNPVSVTESGAPAALQNMFGLLGTGPAFVADVNAPIVAASDVDPGNFQGCNAWAGTPFAGSIALISRGSCNFSVKVDNAGAAGALAVVVFNNQSNIPIEMGALEATTIPSVMIGQADGQAVEAFLDTNPGAAGMIESETIGVLDAASGNVLNGGSLQGPNRDFDLTKPSIAGPGTNIFAASADGGSSVFRFLSGTSMSSPHLAGSAALMMAEHPDWTVMEIKSALMMTANQQTNATDGVTQANPDEVGSGMVDLSKAALAGLVMHETVDNMLAADPAAAGDPRTVNVPSTRSTDCGAGCAWQRTVRNSLETNSSWNVAAAGTGFNVTVTPTNFELLPGDVFLRDGAEDVSGPASSFQTLDIDVDACSNTAAMAFGDITLSENGAQAPDARLTIACSAEVPPAPTP